MSNFRLVVGYYGFISQHIYHDSLQAAEQDIEVMNDLDITPFSAPGFFASICHIPTNDYGLYNPHIGTFEWQSNEKHRAIHSDVAPVSMPPPSNVAQPMAYSFAW